MVCSNYSAAFTELKRLCSSHNNKQLQHNKQQLHNKQLLAFKLPGQLQLITFSPLRTSEVSEVHGTTGVADCQ